MRWFINKNTKLGRKLRNDFDIFRCFDGLISIVKISLIYYNLIDITIYRFKYDVLTIEILFICKHLFLFCPNGVIFNLKNEKPNWKNSRLPYKLSQIKGIKWEFHTTHTFFILWLFMNILMQIRFVAISFQQTINGKNKNAFVIHSVNINTNEKNLRAIYSAIQCPFYASNIPLTFIILQTS